MIHLIKSQIIASLPIFSKSISGIACIMSFIVVLLPQIFQGGVWVLRPSDYIDAEQAVIFHLS